MAQRTLGERLKAARERVGLSVVDAAKKLGYPSYQTLSKIEAGSRKVKASELHLFAKSISVLWTASLARTWIRRKWSYYGEKLQREPQKQRLKRR